MTTETYIGLIVAVLGFLAAFFQWRGKTKVAEALKGLKEILDSVVDGVAKGNSDDTKQAIKAEVVAKGIKDKLDEILVERGHREA